MSPDSPYLNPERLKPNQKLHTGRLRKDGVYLPVDIFDWMDLQGTRGHRMVYLDGDLVRRNSLSLRCFREYGIQCAHCGLVGSFFAKERESEQFPWHLQLYAVDSQDDQVLMTVDHVVPRSKGGRNTLMNLQPLCTPCNQAKANFDPLDVYGPPF